MINATVEGVDVEVLIDGSFSIERTTNRRGLLRCQIFSLDASYRPALDDEIILEDDSVSPPAVVFAGLIVGAREHGHGGPDIPIATDVTASDYNALASRRYFGGTIPAGTLKDALLVVVDYIPLGVTLDGAQVDGPTLEELNYTAAKAEAILNDLALLSGYVWEIDENKKLRMFEPGTVAAPFNLTENAQIVIGDVWVEPVRNSDYANTVFVKNGSIQVEAKDLGEIAAVGEWETVYQADDAQTEEALQAMADAILARSLPILKTLEYTVDSLALWPGMTQTINLPSRNVNNTYLLGDVNISLVPDGAPDELWSKVQATEGLAIREGFRDTYKRWNDSGRGVNGVSGGGGGGSTSVRSAYFLGASGAEAVRSSGSPSPIWIPVSGGPDLGQGAHQVQINTVTRGTTSATIMVNLRALTAGQTVQARLYDVTDSTPCPGTSAVVTSLDGDSDGITEWQYVTFGVTLTAGNHIYELQLLPGTADADVQGVGTLI